MTIGETIPDKVLSELSENQITLLNDLQDISCISLLIWNYKFILKVESKGGTTIQFDQNYKENKDESTGT